ncbi:MAG: DUF1934 family protein [Firmicutes bacterium]|nr:DUF1934 family protein [Bacillota bacterium]
MKNMEIEFSIISLDSKANFNTKAEFFENRLKFIDDEGNTHYILFKEDNKIEYVKRGSVSMQYRFDTSKQTHGTYEVDGNKFILEIKTLSLINNSELLKIDYELLLEGEVINSTSILIKYL